ncbi:Alkaline phosphatase synthesis sensor protein PhoR [Candidatus Nitrosocosmicus oleophilus]|uniref:histidine kinase n=1 Tax=Candidatus Nitrosocosmicus oleophilus TaxID=1353260 RepID=A0A654LZZ6_9ARCH|nr:HAMP domain-containing sensor histidine kinase [Candidatus Nitrosocosmicus oleophilus]ALI37038.1 Alkaline phosphatase synthesis sensor protein PhoR [Candidatus Nitrosocosmicus oleophilus]
MKSDNVTRIPKSEILYGSENAMRRGISFMKTTKTRMDIAFDKNAPSIVVQIPGYRDGYKDVIKRGAKIRCITEVTYENTRFCKELLNMVTELRHLNGLSGRIAVNESEYMTTTGLQTAKPITEIIYSNVDEVVAQGRDTFESLWSNAFPAIQRIREIEKGTEPIFTKILQDDKEIRDTIFRIIRKSKFLLLCTSIGGIQISHEHFLDINIKILRAYNAGKHDGIKWVTSINDKSDVDLVNLFSKYGMKIKHTLDRPSINFVISDKYFASTTEKMINGEMISNLLFSNDPVYLEHFSTIFNNTWKNSMNLRDRTKEIKDANLFKTQVISDPQISFKMTNQFYASAKKEILIILTSVNSLLQLINSGSLEKLNELGSRGLSVKVLIIQSHKIDHLKEIKFEYPQIEFRTPQFHFPVKNRITIVDRTKTIIQKIKDDSKTKIPQTEGITTYIEGELTAWSHTAIFDTLWKQSETVDKLRRINKHLQSHEKMQKEYIDIIAHELRSPIQPIIGLTEYVKEKLKDKKQIELLDSVIASGQKLNMLTESILDVSRIEDHLFSLKEENLDLNELLQSIIRVFKKILKRNEKVIKFTFFDSKSPFVVLGDRNRLEQVISNLIHNSIKSITRKYQGIDGGEILIKMERKKPVLSINPTKRQEIVHIIIEDNGDGIEPALLPKLFTKFTKSSDGNGLGLYISRKIIEAHGGKIWAANMRSGNGAKISISLPLSTQVAN